MIEVLVLIIDLPVQQEEDGAKFNDTMYIASSAKTSVGYTPSYGHGYDAIDWGKKPKNQQAN